MFDPTLPQANTEIDAVQMRGQLNGLHDLITAIVQIAAAQIDGVSTLNPGDPAGATVTLAGTTLHFTFAIPRGDEGVQGAQGIQGPPFAAAVIDTVNTLPPGSAATVTVSFDGTAVHFTFGIPQGTEGAQGPPGEVTNLALAMSIAGTSSNSNGVSALNMAVSDPPTQPEMQSIANKLDELIAALRRA